MFSSANVQANEAGIWFFRDKGVGYTATARREKGKREEGGHSCVAVSPGTTTSEMKGKAR